MTNLPPAPASTDHYFEDHVRVELGTHSTGQAVQSRSSNATADPLSVLRRLEELTQGMNGRLASDAWYYLEAVCVLLSVTRTPTTRLALLGFAKSPSQLVRKVWESQLSEITSALLSPYIALLLDSAKASPDGENQFIQFVLAAIESTFAEQRSASRESHAGGQNETD